MISHLVDFFSIFYNLKLDKAIGPSYFISIIFSQSIWILTRMELERRHGRSQQGLLIKMMLIESVTRWSGQGLFTIQWIHTAKTPEICNHVIGHLQIFLLFDRAKLWDYSPTNSLLMPILPSSFNKTKGKKRW